MGQEHHMFQKQKQKQNRKRTYFSGEVKKIPMCLICRESVALLKEYTWLASLVYITCLVLVDI